MRESEIKLISKNAVFQRKFCLLLQFLLSLRVCRSCSCYLKIYIISVKCIISSSASQRISSCCYYPLCNKFWSMMRRLIIIIFFCVCWGFYLFMLYFEMMLLYKKDRCQSLFSSAVVISFLCLHRNKFYSICKAGLLFL